MNASPNNSKLILIVDDEPSNLIGLMTVLKITFASFGISEYQVDQMVH